MLRCRSCYGGEEYALEQMLEFEGFESVTWFEREAGMEGAHGDSALWTLQYHVGTRADLERYLVEGAARMRGDGLERFSGRFEASRRVLLSRSS